MGKISLMIIEESDDGRIMKSRTATYSEAKTLIESLRS